MNIDLVSKILSVDIQENDHDNSEIVLLISQSKDVAYRLRVLLPEVYGHGYLMKIKNFLSSKALKVGEHYTLRDFLNEVFTIVPGLGTYFQVKHTPKIEEDDDVLGTEKTEILLVEFGKVVSLLHHTTKTALTGLFEKDSLVLNWAEGRHIKGKPVLKVDGDGIVGLYGEFDKLAINEVNFELKQSEVYTSFIIQPRLESVSFVPRAGINNRVIRTYDNLTEFGLHGVSEMENLNFIVHSDKVSVKKIPLNMVTECDLNRLQCGNTSSPILNIGLFNNCQLVLEYMNGNKCEVTDDKHKYTYDIDAYPYIDKKILDIRAGSYFIEVIFEGESICLMTNGDKDMLPLYAKTYKDLFVTSMGNATFGEMYTLIKGRGGLMGSYIDFSKLQHAINDDKYYVRIRALNTFASNTCFQPLTFNEVTVENIKKTIEKPVHYIADRPDWVDAIGGISIRKSADEVLAVNLNKILIPFKNIQLIKEDSGLISLVGEIDPSKAYVDERFSPFNNATGNKYTVFEHVAMIAHDKATTVTLQTPFVQGYVNLAQCVRANDGKINSLLPDINDVNFEVLDIDELDITDMSETIAGVPSTLIVDRLTIVR